MASIQENHQREQYFFDSETVTTLADWLAGYARPCCLCAPSVGVALARRGAAVSVLDIDERFAGTAGFRRWDLYRPEALAETFDVILVDPPFFKVSLSQLFHAVRLLCRFDLSHKLVVSWLVRREAALLGTFAPFGLMPTGYCPGYQTVKNCARNEIMLYANFDTGLAASQSEDDRGSTC